MNREDWLAQRRLGVGGSDCASLFNLGYGCRRRLFYQKRDVTPDFPRQETKLMRLGNTLEPLFSDIYAEETGRFVRVEKEPFVSAEIPELRVNVDRTVFRSAADPGVLEIKSVGRSVFYKMKREGLVEDYILQVQHGLTVTGFAFGAFAIGNRDNGDLVHWDVERDETICKEIAIAAPIFWAQVQNGPMPDALEPDDPRCGKCEYRVSCQGNALIQIETGEMPQVQELAPLVEEYISRKAILSEAEALVEETAEELKTRLGTRQAVYAGERKVYFRPSAGRTTYKSEELLKAYRDARAYIQSIIVKMPNAIAAEALSNAEHPTLPAPEDFVGKSKPSRPLRVY